MNFLSSIIEKAKAGRIEEISPAAFKELLDVRENDSFHDNDPVLFHIKRVLENLVSLTSGDARIVSYFKERLGDFSRKDLILAAAVFHDIAKGKVYIIRNGITSCPGHEEESAVMASEFLSGKNAGADELEYIIKIIRFHGLPHRFLRAENRNIDSDFDLLAEKYSDIYLDLLVFIKADAAGSQLEYKNRKHFDFINSFIDKRIESFFRF